MSKSTIDADNPLVAVLDFTDEELSEVEDISAHIVEAMRLTTEQMDAHVSEEMQARGMDLRVTMEVLPRGMDRRVTMEVLPR